MKRIGLITWDFDPPKGGLGRAMQELRSALLALGHDVTLFTPKRTFGGPFLFSLRLFFVLPRWIRRNRIDAVIYPVGPGGIFLFRKPSVRALAISYHTYGQQSRDVPGESWKKLCIPLEQASLRTADRILCYSRNTEAFLQKKYDIAAETIQFCIQLLPKSLFVDSLIKKERGLCVAVLRLDKRKGLDVLLRAWPMIQHEHANARLVIVGDGVLRSHVDRFTRLFPNVRRVSTMNAEALHTLVAEAEIALCPAYLEGFGLAAAEAMLLGTALVASDADGLRSLVKHGILFHPGGAEAFAHAVRRLLGDEELRTNLARAARLDMRTRFSPELAQKDLQAALD